MSPSASLVSLPLAGEAQTPSPDDLTLDTLPGKFTLTRTDAALTAYGGLVAWSAFLKHLGIIERYAQRRPRARRLPAYAPELDPVEYVWGHLQQHALANFCPKDFAELGTQARRALRRAQCRPSRVRAFWQQAELAL